MKTTSPIGRRDIPEVVRFKSRRLLLPAIRRAGLIAILLGEGAELVPVEAEAQTTAKPKNRVVSPPIPAASGPRHEHSRQLPNT